MTNALLLVSVQRKTYNGFIKRKKLIKIFKIYDFITSICNHFNSELREKLLLALPKKKKMSFRSFFNEHTEIIYKKKISSLS